MFVTISEGTRSRQQAPWRSNFKKEQKEQNLVFPTLKHSGEHSNPRGALYLQHSHHHHLNRSVEIRNSLHKFVFFQPLHDDGEDDWQGGEGGKKSQERKRITWRTQCNIYILIPGAAMVIREMTTWEMPFTAAFYRGDTRRVNLWKVKGNIVSLKKCVQTVEWPSLLPFSSVTAMPFRISLKKTKQRTVKWKGIRQ